MPLSQRDLDALRKIVREEVESALRNQCVEPDDFAADDIPPDHRDGIAREAWLDVHAWRSPVPGEHPAITERREFYEKRRKERERRAAARAAIPIPDTPFVEIYDARRLLKGTGATANAWIRRGRLKRVRIGGRLRVSRAEIDAIVAETKKK